MAKGRTTPAESMNDVLDMALRRRQRGILSIESQQGNVLEEGEIYVEDGQITYARTNQSGGQAALQTILGWRGVYFTFATKDYPARVNAARPDTAASPVTTKVQGETPLGLQAPVGSDTNLPITPPGIPQLDAGRVAMLPSPDAAGSTAEVSRLSATMPGTEGIVPRRVDKEQNVLSLPLTRPQRSIYMLVDGRRSISDLARCTRKTMQEIVRMLSELQERGLIIF